jgi:hypothetical protein
MYHCALSLFNFVIWKKISFYKRVPFGPLAHGRAKIQCRVMLQILDSNVST